MAATHTLTNRVALITGAGRGIGFAIAEELGRRGARIGLNDLAADDAQRAVERLRAQGVEAFALPGSAAVAADANAAVQGIERHFGGLDILINNAGVLRATRAEHISDEEWDFVVDGNLKSTFYCCRAAIEPLRRRGGGSIVNMSSSAGKSVSTIGGAHYTAAKAAVLGLTRHLARELAADGIRVNAVCPGLIDTEMVRATISKERIAAYAAGFPAGRLGEPRKSPNSSHFSSRPAPRT